MFSSCNYFSVQHGAKFETLIFSFVLSIQEGSVTFGQLVLPLTCSRFYLFNNIQREMNMEKKRRKIKPYDVRRSPLVTLLWVIMPFIGNQKLHW